MRTIFVSAMLAIAAMLMAAPSLGQDVGNEADRDRPAQAGEQGAEVESGEAKDARQLVEEAVDTVEQMKREEGLAELLEQAHGVFIIPDYAKVAAVVGGQGGQGVAMLRQGEGESGKWSAPAFYNIGGASAGAEIGAKAGRVVMLLMNEKTADMFKANENNNWSLNADAGLTIVNYSTATQGSAGSGDVVVWTDTAGAFAGASIGVSDIRADEDENAAYYGESAKPRQILSGEVSTDRAEDLREALASAATGKDRG